MPSCTSRRGADGLGNSLDGLFGGQDFDFLAVTVLEFDAAGVKTSAPNGDADGNADQIGVLELTSRPLVAII